MLQFPQKFPSVYLIIMIPLMMSLSTCSVKYGPKKVETCIHNPENSAQCNDMRLPEGSQDYERKNLTNYICTNLKDEEYLFEYANDLRQRLIKCESGQK